MIPRSFCLFAAMIAMLMAFGCATQNSYAEKHSKSEVLIRNGSFHPGDNAIRFSPNAKKNAPERDLTLVMTYTSEKTLTVTFKPKNCAFETYEIKSFPAAKEPNKLRTRIRFDELQNPAVPTLMTFRSAGKFEVSSLKVIQNSRHAALPDTMVPRTLRKNNPTHKRIMSDAVKAPKDYVLMFGDSLTDNWRHGKRFESMKTNFPVVNAGICGDRVEDVLFRMNEMQEDLKKNPPSVVTFLIGTNNIGLASNAADIADGIWHLVWQIHQYCPNAKVIVFGIPPRAMPGGNRALAYTYKINRKLLNRANPNGPEPSTGKIKDFRYVYFDFSDFLADPDLHLINKDLYENDCLHFSDKGYAEVLTPFIAGAIRIVQSEKLPKNYFQNNLNWQKYLAAKYKAANANFSLEEQLGLEWHRKCIAPFWMEQFKKLEKDPKTVPGYPEELVRQSREEGLPPSAGISL